MASFSHFCTRNVKHGLKLHHSETLNTSSKASTLVYPVMPLHGLDLLHTYHHFQYPPIYLNLISLPCQLPVQPHNQLQRQSMFHTSNTYWQLFSFIKSVQSSSYCTWIKAGNFIGGHAFVLLTEQGVRNLVLPIGLTKKIMTLILLRIIIRGGVQLLILHTTAITIWVGSPLQQLLND